MCIHIRHLPKDIRKRYHIDNFLHTDNYVYVHIKKGMYRLKQAAVLAYNKLVSVLKSYGYKPCPMSTGLWTHETRKTKFCVCVDDFGIKYFNQDDADHLINSLKNHYKLTIDWKGEDYCGLHLKWNYSKQYVDVSMPQYIDKLLLHHDTTPPLRPVYTPHPYSLPAYGKRTQFASPPDQTPVLNITRQRRIQSIVGSLLYYARAIDGSILPALNQISATQARPTEDTEQKNNHLLAFVKSHRNTTLRFHASDMILHIDSDAAYLVMPAAKSRIAGYYYLSSKPTSTSSPPLNGAILIECKTLKHVVASAAEAETGGLFHNAQTGLIVRQALSDLVHPQPQTSLKTDNSTANSFVHNNMKQKRSKSWDMRYHWLRDSKTKGNYNIFWASGKNNHADYYTKHHPPQHHREMRAKYFHLCSLLTKSNKQFKSLQHQLNLLTKHAQGCVTPLPPG